MGFIKSIYNSINGDNGRTEIITSGVFDEHQAVTSGMINRIINGQNLSVHKENGLIFDGTKIFVPQNIAAVVLKNGRVADIVSESGVFVYQDNLDSNYYQNTGNHLSLVFVNLREILNIKFGTKGPLQFNDLFYGVDLEIFSYGTFSLQIVNPVVFLYNFVPVNSVEFNFDYPNVRSLLLSEFRQSLAIAISSLSATYRVSQLPSVANELFNSINNDQKNVGLWEKRFGIKITNVALENIELSDDSAELVRTYSRNKMQVKAYGDYPRQTLTPVNQNEQLTNNVSMNGNSDNVSNRQTMSIEKQIEALNMLKELRDNGVLTDGEFNIKKKEILNL